jgi:hypothetical protein
LRAPFDSAAADECGAADPRTLAQHALEKPIEVVKRNRHGRRDALIGGSSR